MQDEVTNCSQRLASAIPRIASPLWPRAAVFDCDGLLVDSHSCWEEAYAQVALSVGRSPDEVELAALNGASVASAAEQLSDQLGVPIAADQVHGALQRSVETAVPKPLRGARSITKALAERMPLAVASNAPREILHQLLDATGLADRFHAIVSADETAADKPAPDVYLEACHRLGVHPSDAVAFEDSPRGALAARRAGLLLVGVPSGRVGRLRADLHVSHLEDPKLHRLLGLTV